MKELVKNRSAFFLVLTLVVLVVAGAVVIAAKYPDKQVITISPAEAKSWDSLIYVKGEVANQGIYPCTEDDTISDIVQAAGGLNDGESNYHLELSVVYDDEEPSDYQKININRAESWLLQSLPGIGESRAEAIITYRKEYGYFSSIDQLAEVEGIGDATCENLREYITVTD